MEQEKLKVEESLNIISEMVSSTKYNLSEDRGIYLMWGYAVAISAIIHYVWQFQLEFTDAHYVWFGMPILGVVNMIYFARKKKKKGVRTYVERALSYIWLAFLFVLLSLITISTQLSWSGVYPVFMFMYGMATISTAGIIKFKPLAIGGVASIISGIFAAFMTFEYQLLLLAFAIICSFVIPGHLLKNTK
jgi:hypothetical protein